MSSKTGCKALALISLAYCSVVGFVVAEVFKEINRRSGGTLLEDVISVCRFLSTAIATHANSRKNVYSRRAIFNRAYLKSFVMNVVLLTGFANIAVFSVWIYYENVKSFLNNHEVRKFLLDLGNTTCWTVLYCLTYVNSLTQLYLSQSYLSELASDVRHIKKGTSDSTARQNVYVVNNRVSLVVKRNQTFQDDSTVTVFVFVFEHALNVVSSCYRLFRLQHDVEIFVTFVIGVTFSCASVARLASLSENIEETKSTLVDHLSELAFRTASLNFIGQSLAISCSRHSLVSREFYLNAGGFFVLSYSLLTAIASTGITYLVLVYQYH